jgi:hemin uptake protein HemP
MCAMSESDSDPETESGAPADASLAADLPSAADSTPDAGPVQESAPYPEGRYQTAPLPIRLFRSEQLFGDARIVYIEHCGATYRLQITARGKLILQK